MEDQRISFETAKLAKEKGFNIPTQKGFVKTYSGKVLENYWADSMGENVTLLAYQPTQSLLQKWLREKYKIHVSAEPIYINRTLGSSEINCYISVCIHHIMDQEYKTFEEALEVGLFEALKLIS